MGVGMTEQELIEEFGVWFIDYQLEYGEMDWEKADKKLKSAFQQIQENRDKQWREKVEGMKYEYRDEVQVFGYEKALAVNEALDNLINQFK